MGFSIHPRLQELSQEIEGQCSQIFMQIDRRAEHNAWKVQQAFFDHRVSESHFAPSTGYGYGDRGRDVLEQMFAQVMDAEDALVRHSFVSGTHALTVALFGLLRPGDTLLCLTGTPYDTLLPVLGVKPGGLGNLAEYGIRYRELALTGHGGVDEDALPKALEGVKVAYIQRSRGYSLRPSFSVAKIGHLVRQIHTLKPEAIVMVDNCYGEFVEEQEPLSVGADLIAGSLIKNPGGGIAKTGGYIAGRKDLVELCAHRLTCPGIGREVGCSLGETRNMMMGLFLAPTVVASALKTAVFAAALLERLGFTVSPKWDEARADIIQSVILGSPDGLVSFCRGIQQGAPIDAFAAPEPWAMPGYDDQVIMAAGAFTLGASIELSADGPMRPPYAAWLQGGLTYPSGKLGILLAASALLS